nr:hypothetical protein [Tanacetum cinerariifolium]GEY22900.1 hypothetical protein [Tanacetum cinerariifolium]
MALHMDEEFYPRYLTTIADEGGAIGCAIDKGLQDGLAAGIDHENDGRESQKDASMADIMDHLHLEGPAAETLEASQLQPSHEQLMLLIYWLEDQVVIGETFLSFSLDVAHARVQRIRGYVAARRLSLADAMFLLIVPLSVKNLTGEASTFGVPSMATTTSLSATFIQASIVPSVPATGHEVSDVGPSTKVSSPTSIVF